MKITFKNFTNWIELNMVLAGFNLTEKLMQQLFADLDPHKKGHLTELDWENAFGIAKLIIHIHKLFISFRWL